MLTKSTIIIAYPHDKVISFYNSTAPEPEFMAIISDCFAVPMKCGCSLARHACQPEHNWEEDRVELCDGSLAVVGDENATPSGFFFKYDPDCGSPIHQEIIHDWAAALLWCHNTRGISETVAQLLQKDHHSAPDWNNMRSELKADKDNWIVALL